MASLQMCIFNALCMVHFFVFICSAQGNIVYVMSHDDLIAATFFYRNLENRGPDDVMNGFVVEAYPLNACKPISGPPFPANSSLKWFALIRMHGCSVEVKLKMAENAGFDAVIVYPYLDYKNSSLKDDFPSDLFDSNVTIVGIRLSQTDGEEIRQSYQYSSGYYVKISPDDPFNIFRYIIPFVIAVGICMMILMLFVLVKYIRERRRNQRNRLSSRHLKQLPVIKFKKGDQYDVCAICLEEYNEGNKLRVLPCEHAYHTKCIDPWLTNNRRTCPICKRKIRLDDDSSDSESDSESEAPTETTPLLRSLAGRALNRHRALTSNLLRNPVINSNQPDIVQSGGRNEGESSQTTYHIRPTLEQQAGPFLQHTIQAEAHTSESDNGSAYSSSAPPFLVASVTGDNEHETQNQPSMSAEQTSSLPNIAPSTSSVEVTIDSLGKGKLSKDLIV